MSSVDYGSAVWKTGGLFASAILRQLDEWGLKTADLVHPPRRFWSDEPCSEAAVEEGVDLRRVHRLDSPAELLQTLGPDDNWMSHTREFDHPAWPTSIIRNGPPRNPIMPQLTETVFGQPGESGAWRRPQGGAV